MQNRLVIVLLISIKTIDGNISNDIGVPVMEIRNAPEERYTIGGVVYGLCYSQRPASGRGHSYLATCPLCEAQIISLAKTQAAALVSDKIRIGVHYRTFHRSR